MIKCPKCKHPQEDSRDSCRWCGFDLTPYKPKPPSPLGAALAFGGTVVAMIALLWLLTRGGLDLRWKHKAGRLAYAPVVVDDTVLLATTDRELQALDVSTGVVRWSIKPRIAVLSAAPVASGGLLFVTDGDKGIVAYRLADGAQVWKYRTRASLGAPAVRGGQLLVPEGRCLRVLDQRSGAELDELKGEHDWVLQQPAAHGERVFLGFAKPGSRRVYSGIAQEIEGGVCAFDLEQQERAWAVDLPQLVTEPPLLCGGVLLVVERRGLEGTTRALGARDGRLLWHQPAGETRLLPLGDAVVQARLDRAHEAGVVEALRQRSGDLVWRHKLSFRIPEAMYERRILPKISDPVLHGSRLYFGCLEDLRCLRADTGQEMWRARLTGRIEQRPVVAGGCLLVSTTDGFVWAIAIR